VKEGARKDRVVVIGGMVNDEREKKIKDSVLRE